MNQRFSKLMLLGLAAISVIACKKENPEEPSPTRISINRSTVLFDTPADSTVTLELESDANWVALIESGLGTEWISVDPERGPGAAELQPVKIHVKANTSSVSRTAQVTFSHISGSMSTVVNVTQSPKLTPLGRDSMALVDLYNSTAGYQWKYSWDLDTPIATWKGVTLGVLGGELRVVSLDLQDQGAEGPLPESLRLLTALKTLQSYANNHGGTLPMWVLELPRLEYLYLASCQYTGQIPQEYFSMVNLRQLDLSGNEGLTGELPASIGQMTKLTELDFEGTQLSGSLPKEIGQMSALTNINMAFCQLSGTLPGEIGQAPELKHIHLDGNVGLTGPIPEGWGDAKKLETININDCENISGPLPASLVNCPEWWELRCSYTRVSGPLPQEWGNARKLRTLQAYNCELSGELPDWQNTKALEELILSNLVVKNWDAKNSFTGRVPEFVGRLSEFHIANNDLEGGLPTSVVNTYTLTSLTLSGNKKMSGEIPSEFWTRPSLVSVQLSGIPFTGQFPMGEVWNNASNLSTIDVTDCKMSGTLPPQLFALPEIQEVRLANNNFTGEVPVTIAAASNLSVLTLNGNRLSGVFPSAIKKHQNWSEDMWNPQENICPQQLGFGFEGTSCTASIN